MGNPNNRTLATSAFVESSHSALEKESSTNRTNLLLNLLILFVALAAGVGFFCGLSLDGRLKDGLATPLQHPLANPDDAFSPVAPKQD